MMTTYAEKQPNTEKPKTRLNVGYMASYALMGIVYEMQAAINEQTEQKAAKNESTESL